MSKEVKRTIIWTTVIGVLGSIAIGLIAMFVFDVDSKVASNIIASGSSFTCILIGITAARAKVNEKKDDGK